MELQVPLTTFPVFHHFFLFVLSLLGWGLGLGIIFPRDRNHRVSTQLRGTGVRANFSHRGTAHKFCILQAGSVEQTLGQVANLV